MKHFKTLLVAAILTLGISTYAQAQKTAHINFQELLIAMPETKKMQSDLDKLRKTYADEISSSQKALKAKTDKYLAVEASQTQAQNEINVKAIQGDQARIQQSVQVAREDMDQKEKAALAPIIEKAKKAISAVAKSKGILYVLDASALIVADGENLLQAVKTNLGIK